MAVQRKTIRGEKNTSRYTDFEKKERFLRRRIIMWKALQKIYMPYLAAWNPSTGVVSSSTSTSANVVPEPDPDDLLPETINLHLPSNLPSVLRNVPQAKELIEKERRLRHAECLDALTSLRRRLRIGARLFDQKMMQTAGTGTRRNTRMQSLIDQYQARKNRDANRYRAARKALMVLDPQGDWKSYLLPLRAEDEVAPFRAQEERKKKRRRTNEPGSSEGYRSLSWIWKTVSQTPDREGEEVSEKEVEDGMFLVFYSQCYILILYVTLQDYE